MRNTLRVEWLDTITSQELINTIKELPTFKPTMSIRPQEDRDDIRLPYFNKAFDECCRNLGRVPSQDEYADHYESLCKDVILKNDLDPFWIRERAKRNVFSFIQEYMVYVLLRENDVDGLFDRGWDIKGVDFLLFMNKDERQKVGILQHAATPAAIQKSKFKDKFRRKGINFPTWSLITEKRKTVEVNGIHLFNTIEQVRSCMVKH
jgi:hypothetical protein